MGYFYFSMFTQRKQFVILRVTQADGP